MTHQDIFEAVGGMTPLAKSLLSKGTASSNHPMLQEHEIKFLETYATLLSRVQELVAAALPANSVQASSTASSVLTNAVKQKERKKRDIVRYKDIRYSQAEAVRAVLADLAPAHTLAQLEAMFPSAEILNTTNPQMRLLVKPADRERFIDAYKGRYNTTDPIVTSDGVELQIWDNWGLYKTKAKGRRVEDTTPRFIRLAQQHGIDIGFES